MNMLLRTLVLAVSGTLSMPISADPVEIRAVRQEDLPISGPTGRPLAEKESADAQFNPALMYDDAQGESQRNAAALNALHAAGYQGLVQAQFNLGVMYAEGQGVPQDYAEALKWYRKAADQGLARAQFNLGSMYDRGQGVPQDYAEAVKWYRKAADQGQARAQTTLGVMYAEGQGVPQDYAEALKWHQEAADQGLAQAQFNLGVMYGDGKGVVQDYVLAHMWFNLASMAQDVDDAIKKRAGENRDGIARRMTRQQIEAAQSGAAKWQPKSTVRNAANADMRNEAGTEQ